MFAARGGFVYSSEELPPAGDTIWYDITASSYRSIATAFSGGTVTTNSVTVSGFSSAALRYRGSVLHPNGNIYYPPRNSNNGMLEFQPSTGNSRYINTGAFSSLTSTSGAYFHSGVLTEQGNILCVPFNYTSIIEYDPDTGNSSAWGSFSGTTKWSGAVLGTNGNVYCVPQNYNGVLEIDTVNKTTTVKTYGLSMTAATKWWGGTRSMKDDRIYMAPLLRGKVLVLAPDGQTATEETYSQTFGTGANEHYGATCDRFGNVVLVQGDSTRTKVINPDSNTAFTINIGVNTYGGITGIDGNVYTLCKTTNTKKIDLSSGNSSPTVTDVYTTVSPTRIAATTGLNGKIYMAPDAASSSLLELDISGNQSIDNYANVVLSPYLQTSKI